MKYISLNDVRAYKAAFHLSNKTWDVVTKWDFFACDTIGKQFVRSIDSISANLAEGFGRYHKKDKIKFHHYSIGSVHESLNWNEKAYRRSLITKAQYQEFLKTLKQLIIEIRSMIKLTAEKLSS